MSYVDIAVGIGMFILFFGLVLTFSINYLVRTPGGSVVITELRERAAKIFEQIFSTSGTPTNWEETGLSPSSIGLVKTIYRTPITVEEKNVSDRTNEPVAIKLTFDDSCANKVWNNTIRIYDENFNETEYELTEQVFCTNQYLNESYIKFNVNISKNEDKTFYVYYSNDSDIPSQNYSLTFTTGSWSPVSGDSWTEATTDWSYYGTSGSVSANSTEKWRGGSSVQISGTFSSNSLGLEYNPTSDIIGLNNSWYIDAWLYVDDMSGLSSVNVSLSDGSDTIETRITDMASGAWYHFERELSSSTWDDWSTFNASEGIDLVRFYMTNSTSGTTRVLKVDEFHFELKPVEVKNYPEQPIAVVSRKKVQALSNISYDALREIIGEDYNFRIEISE